MLPFDLEAPARDAGADGDPAAAAAWLFSPAAAHLQPARRYRFYLKWMYETFHAVEECFGDPAAGGIPRGTSASELLYLANRLYVLDSFGVPGALLECGAFRGFSTCCLSHACDALGRGLIVADSFAGLPPSAEPAEAGYRAGDFRGSLDEVRDAVAAYGRPAAVEYRVGLFEQSLRGWQVPLALLWIDVDLYRSTLEVLQAVFPALDRRGAILCHEFLAERIVAGNIVHDAEPPGALRDYFAEHAVESSAEFLCGWTAAIRFPATPAPGAERLLTALLPELRDRDHRARAARQAIGVRAGLKDVMRRATRRPGEPR